MKRKYDTDAENPMEKLRLKWHQLWNVSKEYIEDFHKTGTSLDTLLDIHPGFTAFLQFRTSRLRVIHIVSQPSTEMVVTYFQGQKKRQ